MDPTKKQRKKLINSLRRIKTQSGIGDTTYRKMYPNGDSSPKLYGLPKIHKNNKPVRHIVSSRGSVTYGVAKELAQILKPLAGNTIHHVNSSEESAVDMKTRLEKGECIMSYDVSTLFTCIPVTSAIEIIRTKVEQDKNFTKEQPCQPTTSCS